MRSETLYPAEGAGLGRSCADDVASAALLRRASDVPRSRPGRSTVRITRTCAFVVECRIEWSSLEVLPGKGKVA
jgi:hypothetical protein